MWKNRRQKHTKKEKGHRKKAPAGKKTNPCSRTTPAPNRYKIPGGGSPPRENGFVSSKEGRQSPETHH